MSNTPLCWGSLLCSSQLTQKMQLPAVPRAFVLRPWYWTRLCPLPDEIFAAGCHVLSATQPISIKCCHTRAAHTTSQSSVSRGNTHTRFALLADKAQTSALQVTMCYPHHCMEGWAGKACKSLGRVSTCMRCAHFMASLREKWRPMCSAVSPVRRPAAVIAALTLVSHGACSKTRHITSRCIANRVSMVYVTPLSLTLAAVKQSDLQPSHQTC